VDNFVGKSTLTPRQTAPSLRYDETMKFSAQLGFFKINALQRFFVVLGAQRRLLQSFSIGWEILPFKTRGVMP